MRRVLSFLQAVFFVTLSLVLLSNKIQAYDVPKYEGLVNDYANVLDDDFKAQLEQELRVFAENNEGVELAVVTIDSLEGDTIENVAQDFFDTWRIGKEKVDNGILFLAAIEDREMRIQLGYGMEQYIPDSAAGRIIRDEIAPNFAEEHYNEGIKQGVRAIVERLQNPEKFQEIEERNQTMIGFFALFFFSLFFTIVSGILIYLAAFFGRSKRWWPGGALGTVLGLFLSESLFGALAFGLIGLFLDYILSKNYKNWKLQKRATDWGKTAGGFLASGSKSSWSSSGSSSSFSFGGGSSGGGGASGGW